jgi:hypothetical protein
MSSGDCQEVLKDIFISVLLLFRKRGVDGIPLSHPCSWKPTPLLKPVFFLKNHFRLWYIQNLIYTDL